MSKKNDDPWYKQCTYETPLEEGGKKEGVSWIPEHFGKVGKKIILKKHPTLPENIWTVTHVGARQRESFLVEHQMDYKHQRKMSDV